LLTPPDYAVIDYRLVIAKLEVYELSFSASPVPVAILRCSLAYEGCKTHDPPAGSWGIDA